MNTCNQCGKSWENPFAKLKHFCRPEIDKSWKEFDTSEGSKSHATDIIKQLQEALELSRSYVNNVHQMLINGGAHPDRTLVKPDLDKVDDALKLIPSLLEQAERWDKGVSLSER